MKKNSIPSKTIERLSLYRRILKNELSNNKEYIFSYDLAALAQCKPDLIRRDLMYLKEVFSTKKGYRIDYLINNIGLILDSQEKQKMAVIGIGNIGRALINFFKGRMKNLEIAAAFDVDKEKTERVISGCRCYHIDSLSKIIKKENITIGIITVPESEAQLISELLINAGIKGIVNIAPVPIKDTPGVYVENLDLTTYFEKTAYFAKLFSGI